MREHPVLSAARNLLLLRVNCDKSTARERADVRTPLLIQREIPARNRPAPVAQYLSKRVAPLSPIGGIGRAGVIGTALRPIHLSRGMCIMDPGHHVSSTSVTVP